MAQGNYRGSKGIVPGLFLLCIFLHYGLVESKAYHVGGPGGWGTATSNWSDGAIFDAGDILVFEYKNLLHNVVNVDKKGFDDCKVPENAEIRDTGLDMFQLASGKTYYFICGSMDHCLRFDQKIAVTTR